MISKKKSLFIGANDMHEILPNGKLSDYKDKYNEGLFIEPIPEVFEKLQKNLNQVNESYGNNFQALQALVTNKESETYDFKLYSTDNMLASSSIFEMRKKHEKELGYKGSIKLQSTRMSSIISSLNLNIEEYDVFLDVQGAELEVLKSFDDHIYKIDWLHTEVSAKEIYYTGGVLFEELNSFLNKHGLFRRSKLKKIWKKAHLDVVYTRS